MKYFFLGNIQWSAESSYYYILGLKSLLPHLEVALLKAAISAISP